MGLVGQAIILTGCPVKEYMDVARASRPFEHHRITPPTFGLTVPQSVNDRLHLLTAVHVSQAGGRGEKNAVCVGVWLLAGFLLFFMAEKVSCRHTLTFLQCSSLKAS